MKGNVQHCTLGVWVAFYPLPPRKAMYLTPLEKIWRPCMIPSSLSTPKVYLGQTFGPKQAQGSVCSGIMSKKVHLLARAKLTLVGPSMKNQFIDCICSGVLCTVPIKLENLIFAKLCQIRYTFWPQYAKSKFINSTYVCIQNRKLQNSLLESKVVKKIIYFFRGARPVHQAVSKNATETPNAMLDITCFVKLLTAGLKMKLCSFSRI
jgi:hypothetical protein